MFLSLSKLYIQHPYNKKRKFSCVLYAHSQYLSSLQASNCQLYESAIPAAYLLFNCYSTRHSQNNIHSHAGEWRHGGGIVPSALSKSGQRGRRCLFKTVSQVYQFHDLSRWTWNKFIAAIRPPRKFRMIFYNFCCYFWGQHCWWTETNTICNDFLISFHCPQLFTALPALPRHVVSTNFAKTLVCKREYDVRLGRHRHYVQ